VEGVSGVTGRTDDAAVSVRDLRLRRGTRQVLDGVGFAVRRGEVLALMGPSGSGKTTILRALAGLEAFEGGFIDVEGVEVPPSAGGHQRPSVLRALRRKVGMVFQFHGLFEHLTVLQNVTLAPVHVHRVSSADAERRARLLLASLGVDHRARALPRELSGGEAQRVAIARALVTDPPVLLMDEPTASLDPARRVELADLVRRMAGQGRTLVIVTHDEDFADLATTRRLVMRDGRAVAGETERTSDS
jgi:ABC-type polar amino acid transport system ATPase subunit